MFKKQGEIMKKTLFFTLLLVVFFILGSCKKETTPEPESNSDPDPQQKVELSPMTKVIKEEDRLAVINIDSVNYTFMVMPGSESFDNLEKGNIIVDGVSEMAPNGYLRKVVSIENDSESGMKIIKTEQATLAEAFKKGSIHFNSGDIKIGQIKDIELAKGVTLKKTKNVNFTVFDFDIDKDIQENGAVINLKGNSKLKMNMFFDFDWSVEFDLDWIPIKVNVDLFQTGVKVNQSTNIKLTAEKEISYQQRFKLATFHLTPITFFVGPVPVVFVPTVDLFTDMEGNITANFSVMASESFEGKLGVKYKGSWSAITEKDFDTDYSAPQLTADASASVAVGPNVSILLYGIAGPYAEMSGCMGLDATLANTNWTLDLNVGMQYNVGIEVDVLGFQTDWSLSNDPLCLFKVNLLHLEDEPMGNAVYITNPVNNSGLLLGSTINIETSFTGNTPDEVKFFIDDENVFNDTDTPFEYLWNTENYQQGEHTIKVVAIISGTEISSDEANVSLTVQQWEQQNLGTLIGSMPEILDVYFLDDENGWVTATDYSRLSNTLLKTTDGGNSWSVVHDMEWEAPIIEIKFMGYNEGVGIAMGGNHFFYLSNGGSDVSEFTSLGSIAPTFDNYLVEHLGINSSADIFVAVMDAEGKRKLMQTGTYDMSINDSVSIPASLGHHVISFTGDKGIVADIRGPAANPKIMVTDDGGSSWSVIDLQLLTFWDEVSAIYIYDNSSIWLSGAHWVDDGQFGHAEDAFVMISHNGGNSWERVDIPEADGFTSISMISSQKGYATVGYKSDIPKPKLYYTDDGGYTWEPIPDITTKEAVMKVIFKGEDFGYIIGSGATAYRFTNSK
jgi:photosystem II stability/assembly factor-like uncharacterized protein